GLRKGRANLENGERVSPTQERATPAGSGMSPASGERPSENYFEFIDVCKAFDDRPVLVDVSFAVKRAETCVIMGRSGVGKSVSLKHIMGFLRADSGQVIVDGEDVTDFTEQEFYSIRKKVTMVFQSGALFDSLTVGDNIGFPLLDQRGL